MNQKTNLDLGKTKQREADAERGIKLGVNDLEIKISKALLTFLKLKEDDLDPEEANKASSPARYIYQLAEEKGLLTKTSREVSGRIVDFFEMENSGDYRKGKAKDRQGKEIAYADIFSNYESTLHGVFDFVDSPQVAEFFKREKNGPYEKLEPSQLDRIIFRNKDKERIEAEIVEINIAEKVRYSKEAIAEIEKEGFVAGSSELEFGKILIDTGKVKEEKGEKKVEKRVQLGFDAVVAGGYDGYVIWTPENNKFSIYNLKKSLKDFGLAQGESIRDDVWSKKSKDKEPVEVSLEEVLSKLVGKDFQPEGKLKEYLEEEKNKTNKTKKEKMRKTIEEPVLILEETLREKSQERQEFIDSEKFDYYRDTKKGSVFGDDNLDEAVKKENISSDEELEIERLKEEINKLNQREQKPYDRKDLEVGEAGNEQTVKSYNVIDKRVGGETNESDVEKMVAEREQRIRELEGVIAKRNENGKEKKDESIDSGLKIETDEDEDNGKKFEYNKGMMLESESEEKKTREIQETASGKFESEDMARIQLEAMAENSRRDFVQKEYETTGVLTKLRNVFRGNLKTKPEDISDRGTRYDMYKNSLKELLDYRVEKIKEQADFSSEAREKEMGELIKYFNLDEKLELFDTRSYFRAKDWNSVSGGKATWAVEKWKGFLDWRKKQNWKKMAAINTLASLGGLGIPNRILSGMVTGANVAGGIKTWQRRSEEKDFNKEQAGMLADINLVENSQDQFRILSGRLEAEIEKLNGKLKNEKRKELYRNSVGVTVGMLIGSGKMAEFVRGGLRETGILDHLKNWWEGGKVQIGEVGSKGAGLVGQAPEHIAPAKPGVSGETVARRARIVTHVKQGMENIPSAKENTGEIRRSSFIRKEIGPKISELDSNVKKAEIVTHIKAESGKIPEPASKGTVEKVQSEIDKMMNEYGKENRAKVPKPKIETDINRVRAVSGRLNGQGIGSDASNDGTHGWKTGVEPVGKVSNEGMSNKGFAPNYENSGKITEPVGKVSNSGMPNTGFAPNHEISAKMTDPVGKVSNAGMPQKGFAPTAYETPVKTKIVDIETVKKGGTVWKLAEKQLEERYGQRFSQLNPAQKTYLIDSVKDQMAKDPEKYGLENIDRIRAGQKIDFSKVFSHEKRIERAFEKAQHLSPRQMENILKNNKNIADWLEKHPGKTLDSQKTAEILENKKGGASRLGSREIHPKGHGAIVEPKTSMIERIADRKLHSLENKLQFSPSDSADNRMIKSMVMVSLGDKNIWTDIKDVKFSQFNWKKDYNPSAEAIRKLVSIYGEKLGFDYAEPKKSETIGLWLVRIAKASSVKKMAA